MATKPRSAKSTETLVSQELQRSTARDWKNRSIGSDIKLPSGNVALVKRVGPEVFLAGGIIPDVLAPVVNEAIRDGQGLKPEKQAELSNDPKQIIQMLEMMDRVVIAAVLEPQVIPAPACVVSKDASLRECGEGPLSVIHADKEAKGWHLYIPAPRDLEDALYVDEVDFEDKSFIMQFAMGGTSDLERFREKQAANVASVSNLKNVEMPS